MKILTINNIKMLQFTRLNEYCNISHFVSTRHGGISTRNYSSMNLGEYCGDDPEAVHHNRILLSDIFTIPFGNLCVPFQVHGDIIRILDNDFIALSEKEKADSLHGVDALITNVPEICIAVTTADCVPLLLYSPDKEVIAAVHAGWRGTVQKITMKTIERLIHEFGCDPKQICVGIGPSISQESFEVGEEVVDTFRLIGADLTKILKRNTETGKAHIDLWEENRLQLLSMGISPDRIEIAGLCTFIDSDDFFSARRLGIESGRMLSGIMIKNNR